MIISTKKSARALRSPIKVVLDVERVKLIISGNQIKKRASNTLFSGDYNYRNKENPLALRARILKLFWKWEKSKSLFWGTNLKRGH